MNTPHYFNPDSSHNEFKTRIVLSVTLLTMTAEIYFGVITGSMALLGDGLHMGTHSLAFLITLITYYFARKHRNNVSFAFGTGKVNDLGAFVSAVLLMITALNITWHAIERLVTPVEIKYEEAILVALIGLTVNLASALLLKENHHNQDGKSHHYHEDHNLRAAYLHVIADGITSVAALSALFLGRRYGWHFLDPLIGIAGSILIIRWGMLLARQTGLTLLDAGVSDKKISAVRKFLEQETDARIQDLHIWRLQGEHLALIVSLEGCKANLQELKKILTEQFQISHSTIELIN